MRIPRNARQRSGARAARRKTFTGHRIGGLPPHASEPLEGRRLLATVTGVFAAGEFVTQNERLVSSTPSLVVAFSDPMSTAGGDSGLTSVTNPANYRLTRNGLPVVVPVGGITYDNNQAAVTFSPALSGGNFSLTVRDAILDSIDNALDGDNDGSPGGDFVQSFRVDPPTAVRPEFRANFTTLDDQQYSAVAMDADGDFVVTWTSHGQDAASSFGVYARRYDAAGAARGGEFLVNSMRTGSQRFSAVAMDADGDFVIAWEGSGPRDDDGIFAQRYDAEGMAQGPEFLVNTARGDTQRSPTVAMDADGDFVIAWAGSSGLGDYDGAFARRYNAAGVAQSGPFIVNSTTDGFQGTPSAAMDASGDFVIAWAGNGGGDPTGIFAKRYNAMGQTQGGQFLVNTARPGDIQRSPTVAMDADGDFVIAWSGASGLGDYDGTFARRYNAAGVARDVPFRVNSTTAGSQSTPSAAMDADGDFVVTWHSSGNDAAGPNQDNSGDGVYAQRYDAAGVGLGGEFRVNSTTASDQHLSAAAMDAEGDFVVTWTSFGQDGSVRGVYSQRFASPLVDGVFTVEGTAGDDTIALSTDAAGDFVYVVNGITNVFSGPVPAGVVVNGLAGADTLMESADTDLTLTDTTLTGPGFITRTLSGIEQVELSGGNSANNIDASAFTLGPVVLRGGAGNDTLRGGTGDDTLDGGAGMDSLVGAAGRDTASYASHTQGVYLTFDGLGNDGVPGENEDLGNGSDLENMTGGFGDDRLVGSTAANVLAGGPGADTADYSARTAALSLTLDGAANDGAAGELDNVMADVENLIAGSGNDTLIGSAADNVLDGGRGTDVIRGGGGVDTADYSSRTAQLAVTLDAVADDGESGEADLVSGDDVENVSGGSGVDFLQGNAAANVLLGNAGNDRLFGGAGPDTLDGGDGRDDLSGEGAADRLSGGAGDDDLLGGNYNDPAQADGDDVLDGGDGDDRLRGGAGGDTFIGGFGVDEVNYAAAPAGVVVGIGDAVPDGMPGEGDLVTADVDNVVGSDHPDTLAGNFAANAISGGGDNDIIDGGDNNDRLSGGDGADRVSGGKGNDAIAGGAGRDVLRGNEGDDVFANREDLPGNLNLQDEDAIFGDDGVDFRQGDINDRASTTGVERIYDPVPGDGDAADAGLLLGGGVRAPRGVPASVTAAATTLSNGRPGVVVRGTNGRDVIHVSQPTRTRITVKSGTRTVGSFTVASNTLLIVNANGGDDVVNLSATGAAYALRISSQLDGGAGNDILTGGIGNDTFLCGTGRDAADNFVHDGNDTFNGGPTVQDTDKVDYGRREADSAGRGYLNVSLDGAKNDGWGGGGEQDNVMPTIEVLFGGAGDDTITGSGTGELLAGGGGNDVIQGNAGNDFLIGSTGRDRVFGSEGRDIGELRDGETDAYLPARGDASTPEDFGDNFNSRDAGDVKSFDLPAGAGQFKVFGGATTRRGRPIKGGARVAPVAGLFGAAPPSASGSGSAAARLLDEAAGA